MVPDGTLELDRGQGFQDFIFHSKEVGFHCEGSGETNILIRDQTRVGLHFRKFSANARR